MDGKFIDALCSMDEKKVKDIISSGKAEACGEARSSPGWPLQAARAGRVEVLKYANSGTPRGVRIRLSVPRGGIFEITGGVPAPLKGIMP